MLRILTLTSIATFAGLGYSAPVQAQGVHCAPRDAVIERLKSKYGEVFSGGGLQNGTAVVEVWTSTTDGTWTILMTRADGQSCIVAAGTDWRKALASQQAAGEPA